MKYIIYGINRVAKDFLYIFEDLEILCLTEDAAETKEIWGYPVQSIEEALENTSYDQIILCGFDNAQKEEKLQKQGLIYGRDYVYERDFFPRLDELSIPKDRRILVWGTGMTCRFFLDQELPFTVDAFVDSYKNNCRFMGKEVLSPEEITDWKSCYVIAAVERAGEIFKELSVYGLTEGEDFTGYQSVLYLPSRMLEKTVFDPSCYDLECNTMENHLEILDYGNTRCCCTTFVKPNLGNVFEKSSSEIWNSILHKILCLSTENKTFSFCDKTMCPLFVAKKSEAEKTKSMKRVYKKMKPV